jgi:hypothetical protein
LGEVYKIELLPRRHGKAVRFSRENELVTDCNQLKIEFSDYKFVEDGNELYEKIVQLKDELEISSMD